MSVEDRIRTRRRIRLVIISVVALLGFGAGCLYAYLTELRLDPGRLFQLAVASLIGLTISHGVGRVIDYYDRRRS